MKDLEVLSGAGVGRREAIKIFAGSIVFLRTFFNGNANVAAAPASQETVEEDDFETEAKELDTRARELWFKEGSNKESENKFLEAANAYRRAGRPELMILLLERQAEETESIYGTRGNVEHFGALALLYLDAGNQKLAFEYARRSADSAQRHGRDFGFAAYVLEQCGDPKQAKLLWQREFREGRYHVNIVTPGRLKRFSRPEIGEKADIEFGAYLWTDEIERAIGEDDFVTAEQYILKRSAVDNGFSLAHSLERLKTKYEEYRARALASAADNEAAGNIFEAASTYEKLGMLDQLKRLIPSVRPFMISRVAYWEDSGFPIQAAVHAEAMARLLRQANSVR